MGGLTASSAPGPRKRSLFTTLRDGRLSRRHWSARAGRGAQYQARLEWCNDARTGMPPGMPGGAMCVQRFDDSLNSAIHITYRISLRSSSMREPRDPLLKVLLCYNKTTFVTIMFSLKVDASIQQCTGVMDMKEEPLAFAYGSI